MEGLALAILLASICILLTPALLFGGVGYFVLRKRAGILGAAIGVALGLAIGALAVVATFMESTWNPPVELTIDVPPDLRHRSIVLLEDPSATAEIPWAGMEIPLSSPSAHLAVPPSGFLRVRSLEMLRTHDRVVRLSTGETAWGMAFLNPPPGLGASQLMYFDFVPYPSPEPDPSLMEPAALLAWIQAREAE
jgi:hypothetical protein